MISEATPMTQHPFIPGMMIPADQALPKDNNPLPIQMPQTCVTVCSVVPWDLHSQRYDQLNGLPTFHIPKCKPKDAEVKFPVGLHAHKGGEGIVGTAGPGYSILRLGNTYSMLMVSRDSNSPLLPTAVPRLAIDPHNPQGGYVQNLIEEFAGGRPSAENGRLGIAIVTGTKPWQEDNLPTDEEVRHLHRIQKNFFLGLINKADVAYQSGDDKLKKAVAWYECSRALTYAHDLYNEPIEPHKWFQGNDTSAPMVTCMACQTNIKASAHKCVHCGEDIASRFMAYGATPEELKMYHGAAKEMALRKKFQKGA